MEDVTTDLPPPLLSSFRPTGSGTSVLTTSGPIRIVLREIWWQVSPVPFIQESATIHEEPPDLTIDMNLHSLDSIATETYGTHGRLTYRED